MILKIAEMKENMPFSKSMFDKHRDTKTFTHLACCITLPLGRKKLSAAIQRRRIWRCPLQSTDLEVVMEPFLRVPKSSCGNFLIFDWRTTYTFNQKQLQRAARRPNPSTSWSLKFRSWARQRDSKSRKDIIDSDGDTVAALAPLGPNSLDVKLVPTNCSEHSSGISSLSWLHLFGSSKNSVAAAAGFTNASMLVIVSALCFKVEHRFCLAQSLPFKRSS